MKNMIVGGGHKGKDGSDREVMVHEGDTGVMKTIYADSEEPTKSFRPLNPNRRAFQERNQRDKKRQQARENKRITRKVFGSPVRPGYVYG